MTTPSTKIFGGAKTQRKTMRIGDRLRFLRERAGVSQDEMARRLSVRPLALAKLEMRDDILVSTLQAYVEALGASLRVDAFFDYATLLFSPESKNARASSNESQSPLPLFGDNPKLQHRDMVFSIKPEYSEKIVGGEKTIELRRRFPISVPSGTTVLIYSTSPTQALTCMAEIGSVFRGSPKQIWKKFSARACVSRQSFDSYFQGVNNGVAIELCRARPLLRSVGLQELRERFRFQPPQSFLYADPLLRKAVEYERSEISN